MAQILLVEDEPRLRSLLERAVAKQGHEVRSAASGAEALSMLEAHHCDLIVTDMFMRDGDGLSLIRSVRERNADLPIVAISGGGSQGFSPQLALSAAQSMGAHILAKPFLPSALAEQIGAALEARRAS